MTHYVLFYVEGYNGPQNEEFLAKQGFGSAVARCDPPSANTKKLGENSWLIHRESDVAFLGQIVAAAENARLKYRVHFLTEE